MMHNIIRIPPFKKKKNTRPTEPVGKSRPTEPVGKSQKQYGDFLKWGYLQIIYLSRISLINIYKPSIFVCVPHLWKASLLLVHSIFQTEHDPATGYFFPTVIASGYHCQHRITIGKWWLNGI